eukprot:s7490_g1.t1
MRPSPHADVDAFADASAQGPKCCLGGFVSSPSLGQIWFSESFSVSDFEKVGIPFGNDLAGCEAPRPQPPPRPPPPQRGTQRHAARCSTACPKPHGTSDLLLATQRCARKELHEGLLRLWFAAKIVVWAESGAVMFFGVAGMGPVHLLQLLLTRT